MIGQYLSQTNENATVPFAKIFETKQGPGLLTTNHSAVRCARTHPPINQLATRNPTPLTRAARKACAFSSLCRRRSPPPPRPCPPPRASAGRRVLPLPSPWTSRPPRAGCWPSSARRRPGWARGPCGGTRSCGCRSRRGRRAEEERRRCWCRRPTCTSSGSATASTMSAFFNFLPPFRFFLRLYCLRAS